MRFAALFPLMLACLGVATLLVDRDSGAIALANRLTHVSEVQTAESPAPPLPLPQPASRADAEPRTQPAPDTRRTPNDKPPNGAVDEVLPVFFMPVLGALVADVPDTFGDPRGSDRVHQGIDILAPRGTPILAAAAGTVQRLGQSARGGLTVTILGDDGLRYFYAHLDSFADGLERGQRMSVDSVVGYVGNTGNAAATAPHLHFEVQLPGGEGRYSWRAFDPLPYLLDRSSGGGQ